ncbi:peptide chain release factor N(5)-glutamine methyltransferase [Pedobacter sp. JY14-1]|uniref:peptide chain release factor N(5)-glutamine methyltransferase n=1 Tax=Pedobacter sp. JY14-1 TaxID=3034151 RepID=UPI0023E22E16|nr:peptide chain release factor N(5)-glutamine methyltransferase [Pedobacter sp. JY14-1]
MIFRQLSELFEARLSGRYDRDEIAAICSLVVEQVSGKDRTALRTGMMAAVPGAELQEYERVLKELQEGLPLQYVLGEADFYGLKFKVSPAVLIPRPETEELVEWVLESAVSNSGLGILDVGTGSGCIAVTLARHLPVAAVKGLDISQEALSIARYNSTVNHVDIEFILADIRGYASRDKFDLIVSNPPYVKQEERADMEAHVLDHEPHLALFVADENPLEFYDAIADFALEHLRPGGMLFFEINAALGNEMVSLMEAKGFKNSLLRKDMQGKDRMLRCSL